MAIEMVAFEVTGISALLMHNPAGSMKASDGGMKTKEQPPTPEEEAARSTYKDADGNFFVPAVAFRNAILAAGTGKKIGKMTAWKAVAAGVFNAEVRCPIFHPKTKKPIKEFTVNLMRVVLKSGGKAVAILRGRAEIAEWACKVALEIDTDFITVSQVKELLGLAGRMIGICDFRPEKKGSFGRFSVR